MGPFPIDRLRYKLYDQDMTLSVAIYKVESGASKRRKTKQEQKSWESKNGPVIITKVEKND